MAEARDREQGRQDWLRVLRRMEKIPDIVSDDVARRVLARSIGEKIDKDRSLYEAPARETIGMNAVSAFLDGASEGRFDEFMVSIGTTTSNELALQAVTAINDKSRVFNPKVVVARLERFLEDVRTYVAAHPFEDSGPAVRR